MIATAIKEMDTTISYVAVRTNGITVTRRTRNGGNLREHWAVPTKAAKAIIRFDAGDPVVPFTFEVQKIDQKYISPKRKMLNRGQALKRLSELAASGTPRPSYKARGRVAGI
jgi:hypothetical protein